MKIYRLRLNLGRRPCGRLETEEDGRIVHRSGYLCLAKPKFCLSHMYFIPFAWKLC